MKGLPYIVFSAVVATVACNSLAKYGSTCAVSDSAKVDCGYAGIDQGGCESKGCCWSPAGDNSATPWCFYAGQSAGYSLSGLAETSTGLKGTLKLIGNGNPAYGPDIKELSLEVVYESEDIIRVKITDANNARWEVPESVVKRSHATSKPISSNLKFSYTESPFSFEVKRVSDGQSLFKLGESFTFKDQYLEIPTSFDASAKTFGLGESSRLNHALQAGHTYTMWAADIPALSFNKNLYGSYPYYLQMINGQAHGVMLMNSNGMDVTLQQSSLAFKTIGGIVDLYVFNGPTPEAVSTQYTGIVGRPTMFPYWSYGFHNCKYGYTSVYQVEEVVANYAKANIPLDTQWMDIDYMQNYRDFSFDSQQFPVAEVDKFVTQLHQNGQHFVPIVDPGIMVYPGYEAYERGLQDNLFIKDIQGNNHLSQVWPGPTHMPDFFHPKAQSYWTDMLKSFHHMAPVDGIWIDMNEISNFCNADGAGQVCTNSAPGGCPAPGASQTDCCLVCTTVDSSNKYDFAPYQINNQQGKLSAKTVPVSSTQYGNVSVYNAHNLYGLTEQIATNQALRDIRNKRPFLLTRSSFLSSGAHTAKWTGDNGASWDDLKSSVISVMDFNMFGVPMVGADICGFIWDTTEELCARWIEVGAFYPFSRNHNALNQAAQELYLWDSVAQASRTALGMRYQLLPYLYSLFYEAHTTGSTVVRALWMNNPSDAAALGVQSQFMWGNGLLISPVLDQGSTSVSAYFPQGYWYNFQDRSFAVDASVAGVWKLLSTPLTSTNVHVRGGSVLPLQQSALTTAAGRQTPFTYLVALCPQGKAFGSLYWDDGEQIELKNYITIDLYAEQSSKESVFTAAVTHDSFSNANDYSVGTIVVMSPTLTAKPTTITLNGAALNANQVSFDAAKKSLTFTIELSLAKNIQLIWA
jgi:alpha-glucosidase (family GH31 glycosyl hydrolase)